MIRERWFIDDYELTDGDVRDVEKRDGTLITPAAKAGGAGGNNDVPQRTGQVWRPKVHDAGGFTLSIWWGNNQVQAQSQYDDILKAAIQPHRLPTWKRITASGEGRVVEAEVVAAVKPTAIGQAGYRADIQVSVPRGYWRGETLYTAVTAPWPAGQVDADGKAYVDLPLPDFAASTAALEELVFRIDGQAVNPVITDITDRGRGEVLSYPETVPDGQWVSLDSSQWLVTGSAGAPVSQEAANYAGERFLTVAAPPPGVTQTLRFSADTLGANAKLTVSGYRSFLV